MRIIVAMDVLDGKCVRLTRGDFSTKKIYSEDPLDLAKNFEDAGIRHIHLVDLDGARTGHIVNQKILKAISGGTKLRIDFSGGLRTVDDIKGVFESGTLSVTVGSIAVNDPDLFLSWLSEWGPEKIILGADCNNRKIVTAGWLIRSDFDVLDFIRDYSSKGVRFVACTDIERDGTMNGPAIGLYRDILEIDNVSLIASGGIATVGQIKKLSEIGCEGAIIGKALYEGKLELKDISRLC
jgi:phosphoribosylformimino-5-aminoimidazole carboxamide ribotide isomerase